MVRTLTFMNPCIASISLKYDQQDAAFSRPIYFYKLLYIFQAVSLPIIRSTKQYVQRQVLSNQYYCLVLSWMRWNAVSPPIIRSTKMYIRLRQVLSNQYCCLLLSWVRLNSRFISSTIATGNSTGLTIPDSVCTVLCSWWWAEERPETYMEQFIEINKSRKCCILLVVI